MVKQEDKEASEAWKKNTNAQIGYGEITLVRSLCLTFVQGALQKVLTLFQYVDQFFGPEDEAHLAWSKQEYKMVPGSSYFLDIGSGFGKPVFHAAAQTGKFISDP